MVAGRAQSLRRARTEHPLTAVLSNLSAVEGKKTAGVGKPTAIVGQPTAVVGQPVEPNVSAQNR